MVVLQVEHPVADFDAWKLAFDQDPVNRQQSGVRRYRVLRPVNQPDFAIIELEFDGLAQAEAMRDALQDHWRTLEAALMHGPETRIVEIVEIVEF